MHSITLEDGVERAFTSLLSDRLALLAGAGLSMAAPSSLPSAATIAAAAKRKYAAIHGAARPPLPNSVDEQAEFFFLLGELATTYFRTLIDPNAFSSPPNAGHYAIADLLLVRAIQTAITTNVDALIENAGDLLNGTIGVGIDGAVVAQLSPDIAPLLKIHGCRRIDAANMVWARGQLGAEPVLGRVERGAQWLETRLLDRDLLIVGFWTDWDYLNLVIERSVGAVSPTRVIVVDPQDPATFPAKAPALYALGARATTAFVHVQSSGDVFLDKLRARFSTAFVRQALHAGIDTFTTVSGGPPETALTEPPVVDNDSLWSLRRDLEGCYPNEPAKERRAVVDPLLGLTLLKLRAAGAILDGSYWVLTGKRIRVIRTPNAPLHAVESRFDRETAPSVAADMIIAVGAEAQMLPSSIARAGTAPSIARGSPTIWYSRLDALDALGI